MPYKVFKVVITGHKVVWTVTSALDDEGAYSVSARYDCWVIKWVEWNSLFSSSEYDYEIGEKITLYCDENNPWTFIVESFINYLLLIAPFILWILVIIWIKNILHRIKINRFKENSIKTEAIIEEILHENNEQWFRIKAIYSDKVFLSEKIFWDVEKVAKKWDKIDLYVDYENPWKYWLDTDNIEKICDEEINGDDDSTNEDSDY